MVSRNGAGYTKPGQLLTQSLLVLNVFALVVQWDYYAIVPAVYYRTVGDPMSQSSSSSASAAFLATASPSLAPSTGAPTPADKPDAITYGWVCAAFALTALVASPVVGGLTDRFGARRPLLLCLVLMVSGNVLFYLQLDRVWALVLARVLSGAGAGGRVACLAYISRVSSREQQGERIGKWYAIGTLGMILGPAASTGLTLVTWHVPGAHVLSGDGGNIPVLSSIALEVGALVLVALKLVPEQRIEELGQARDRRGLLRSIGPVATDDSDTESHGSFVYEDTLAPDGSFLEGWHDGQQLSVNSLLPGPATNRAVYEAPVSSSSTTLSQDWSRRDAVLPPAPAPAGPWPRIPRGLFVLMVTQFVLVFSVSAFELLVVPLLNNRFDWGQYVASLTLLIVGVIVLVGSAVTSILMKQGRSERRLAMVGMTIFVVGCAMSVDYTEYGTPLTKGGLIALEAVSVVLVGFGFTLAFITQPSLYLRIIRSTKNPDLISRIGVLMSFLSIAASCARTISPLVDGYGLTYGSAQGNEVLFVIVGSVVLTMALWFLTMPLLRLGEDPKVPQQSAGGARGSHSGGYERQHDVVSVHE